MAAKEPNDRLIEHSYDGIQEFDNPLPRWWVYLFYATIIFSVLYYFNVPGIGVGKGRLATYDAEMTAAQKQFASQPAAGDPTPVELAAMAGDQKIIGEGKAIFVANCVACHRADGGGQIGPNLTDAAWIHGGTLPEVRKTINEGVLAKGMPQWGKVFKPQQVNAVAVYVMTLGGTNPPNAKAPEGTPAQP